MNHELGRSFGLGRIAGVNMGPFHYLDDRVEQTLEGWLALRGEVFAEIYTPNSGTGGDYYRLTEAGQLRELMDQGTPKTVGLVLRDDPLPVRGVVTDELIERALKCVEEGHDLSIVAPCVFPRCIEYLTDGADSHEELRHQLEELHGVEVWIGPDFDFPNDYWTPNASDNALIVWKSSFESLRRLMPSPQLKLELQN